MDHPRSRGEYLRRCQPAHFSRGSSPLSRGILGGEHGGAGQPRIIPALAGNTSPAHRAKNPCRDHPRSRGEYDAEQVGDVGGEGSSPLSRGIPTNTTDRAVSARIIPALAGNTPSRDAATDFDADHPRSRGEYDSVFPAGAAGLGSSPLSRGIPSRCWRAAAGLRIIPALAGNTILARLRPGRSSDHPRSRGEYAGRWGAQSSGRGSSPLSRGIPAWTVSTSTRSGIIPALAGNTLRTAAVMGPRWDHPRSRGEYTPVD